MPRWQRKSPAWHRWQRPVRYRQVRRRSNRLWHQHHHNKRPRRKHHRRRTTWIAGAQCPRCHPPPSRHRPRTRYLRQLRHCPVPHPFQPCQRCRCLCPTLTSHLLCLHRPPRPCFPVEGQGQRNHPRPSRRHKCREGCRALHHRPTRRRPCLNVPRMWQRQQPRCKRLQRLKDTRNTRFGSDDVQPLFGTDDD